jgi:hypothetical protein
VTLVSDIVQVNAHGAFFNDVQLGSYRDHAQRELLSRTYIFTMAEKGQEVGSVNLLETMISAFLPGQTPNRMMVIATFGHGKSHFAVSAATYFGSALGDPALTGVLEGLQHAIADPIRFEKFNSFKQNRKPFLIVLLSGDEAGDLASKFSRALETALKDHEATAAIKPPFWFAEAEKLLQTINEARTEDADRALEPFELDLAALRDKVARREDDAFEMVREVSYALYGLYPDFQGATNLGKLVEWTVDSVCGNDGPMGGLLILFDEFSSFVQAYGAGRSGRHASPLQDLLNGVANRRERAAFVALGQVDPHEIARGFGGAQLDSLAKELDRIETSRTLRSVLEEVLDSFLKQDESVWKTMSALNPLRQGIDHASEAAWRIFPRRYQSELKWTQPKFLQQVGYGCFPLHPMTTALFSTIEYRATNNPRSVLRFVLDAAEARMLQPAVVDGNPNWTLPYELVDYFEEMIDPRSWEQYDEVRREIGGDITPVQERVLKAMLLISAAFVPVRELGFETIAAFFAGIKRTEASQVLEALSQRGLVRYDAYTKAYGFWPVGGGAYRLEQLIDQELSSMPIVTEAMLEEAIKTAQRNGQLPSLEVPVQLGHAEDWLATQHIFTVSSLIDSKIVTDIANSLVLDIQRSSGPRGAAIWALATTDTDITSGTAGLSRILDDAIGDREVPLVVLKPTQTIPQLLYAIRRICAIRRLTPDKIPDGSELQLREIKGRAAQALVSALQLLADASQPLAPRAFRAEVQSSNSVAPKYVLEKIYLQAFRNGPRSFYRSYKISSAPLTTAIVAIAQALSEDRLTEQTALFGSNKVATDLVEKMLRPTWGIVNASRRLQFPPDESPIYQGWRMLSDSFQPGSSNRSLQPILNQLLNPPYGYDPRTLTLLFAAWYGWHRHDLTLRVGGRPESLENLLSGGSAKKKVTLSGFLAQLTTGTLSRQDEAEIEKSVKDIVDAIENGANRLDMETAQDWLAVLTQFVTHPRATEATRQRVVPVSARLRKSIELAKDYDAKAGPLLTCVNEWQVVKPGQLVSTIAAIRTLPVADLVRSEQPPAESIESQALDALKQKTEQICATYELLADLGLYEKHRQTLGATQGLVRDFPELTNRVKVAQERLEENKRKKEDEARKKRLDEAVNAELRGMSVSPETSAATLQSYLDRLTTLSPGTDSGAAEVTKKREQIAQQVSTLETRVRTLGHQLEETSSRQEISAIRDRGLRLEGQVRGSNLESALGIITERSEALLGLFSRLEEAARLPTRTPGEAGRAEAALVAVRQEFDGTGENFLRQVDEKIQHVRDFAHAQQREALKWLELLETTVERHADPWELDQQAAYAPPFLPDSMRPRLTELRQKIEHKKNSDRRRQVVDLFESIGDEAERQALARDLWQLAFEGSPQISVVE